MTIVVAPAWCLGQHGRRGASNHVSGQRYFGDVCSALASQFASWKSRASRARAQNKGGDQKRAARLQQHAHAPETLSIDSIESSSGVATIAEGERGREGARGGARAGGARLKFAEEIATNRRLTALASHDGDAKRSTSWLCRFPRPGSHNCLMGPPR